MRSYIALQGRAVHQSGWTDCVLWAREHATESLPVKIVSARAGEAEGRVVAEIAPDGECIILRGRMVSLKRLRNAKQ